MPHTILHTDVGGKPAVQTVTIRTAQPKKVGLFYCGLGLTVSQQSDGNGQTLLAAKCTGLTLLIVPAQQPSDPNETMLNFAVDSLVWATEAAAANQGKIVMKPFETQWGLRAIVTDPDGRRLVITELRADVEAKKEKFAAADEFDERPRRSDRRSRAAGYDEVKALEAVKRGVIVILLGIIVQMLGFLGLFATLISTFSDHNLWSAESLGDQASIFGVLVAAGMLAQLVGKVVCGIPSTSRAGYAPLWAAVGLEGATHLLSLLTELDKNSGLGGVAKIVGLAVLAAPFLFVLFLGNLMEEIRNDTLAGLAKTTNGTYGIMLVSLFTGGVFSYFMPGWSRLFMVAMGLVVLAYIGFYMTLLVKVLGVKALSEGIR